MYIPRAPILFSVFSASAQNGKVLMPDAVPVLSIEEHMSTVTVVEKPMKPDFQSNMARI
jgi:hypothetical protein